ncbi:MAG: peptidyl-prolyl cis-trans isomerase [Spirochaetaceae bacterium]|jgi:parvulin-like peptidyl-prolyl isomerase|nr:peptidyl-prolyl cis-trans isomerase [Spirochaetaceae bacterium]
MKKKLTILLFFCGFINGVYAGDLDTVATVKLTRTEPITVKELKAEVDALQKITGQKLTVDDRRKVLVEKMIPERLVLQAADRDKLYADEKAVDQQLAQLRAALSRQLGRQAGDVEFAEAVRSQTGMDVPAYRAELKRQYIIQQYVMKYAKEKKAALVDSVKEPEEAEIVKFFNLNKAQAVMPDTVRVSMIQIPFGAAGPEKEKAKETGRQLEKEIGSSAIKFDQVYVRASGGTAGYAAGDPGPIPRNAEAEQVFGSDFMDAVFKLKLGDVSKMIETPRAFYIVKVTDIYEQRTLTLDDEIQPGNSMTMREYIKMGLYQQKQQDVLKQIQDELVAELSRGNPFTVNEKYISY